MKITPLAAESMGARSMATFIETGHVNILIDPGVGLAKKRFELPPHPLEQFQAQKLRDRILLFAQSAHILIITHFHEDHLMAEAPQLAQGKIVFMKNPNQDIPAGQRRAAFQFIQAIKGSTKDIVYMDGRTFDCGPVRLTFSNPVCHGPDLRLGSVIACHIQEERTFLFTSDMRGECFEETFSFIRKNSPEILYMDGPEVHIKDTDSDERLTQYTKHLEQLILDQNIKELILDHALLRDGSWERILKPVMETGTSKNIQVSTAATYRGEDNHLLESRRKELFKNHPSDNVSHQSV